MAGCGHVFRLINESNLMSEVVRDGYQYFLVELVWCLKQKIEPLVCGVMK